MKPTNFKPTKQNFLLFFFSSKMAAVGYSGAKIALKEDAVAILFPAVEAILTPSIRRIRTPSATRAATTTSLGSKASGPRTVTDTVSANFYLLTYVCVYFFVNVDRYMEIRLIFLTRDMCICILGI